MGNQGSRLTSPLPSLAPSPPCKTCVRLCPGIRAAPGVIQAKRGDWLLPGFLSDLPLCCPHPPRSQVWGGGQGETIFPLRAPYASFMLEATQSPRGPHLRRGNRKNGFLMGTTMAWRWDESAAGAEGSEGGAEGRAQAPRLWALGQGAVCR